ncbi:MAG: hypothetical protein ACC619_05510 [Paracoccaceae bacterium]
MTYDEQSDHIATLLEQRLNIRGNGLDAKLRKSGRLLPRHIHRDGQQIVESTNLQGNPRLARRIDADQVLKSYRACEKYLMNIDVSDRRQGRIIGLLATNALNFVIIFALLTAVLVWRGFL